jgi:glycosyltransferase involved in cell wall biosynthesis
VNVGLFLPNLNGGGAERAALLLARHWPADERLPVLLLRQATGPLAQELGELEVHTLDLPPHGLRATVLTPPRLASLTRRLGIDVVVAFLSMPSVVLAKVFDRRLRVAWSVQNPVGVVAASDSRGRRAAAHARGFAVRRFDRHLDYLFLPVPELRAGMSTRTGRTQITVLANPLDPDLLDGALIERGKDHKTTVVIAARLVPQKRIDLLLRAFAVVVKAHDAVLVVAGVGPEYDALQALASELGIATRVQFLGFVTPVSTVLGNADLFVLSSDYEGFGVVLLEALALGLPIVSTDAPFGPRHILDGGTYGDLVPTGDVGALADAILHSLETGGPATSVLRRQRAAEYSAPLLARRLVAALRGSIDAG